MGGGILTPGPGGELNAAYRFWLLMLGPAKIPLEKPVSMRAYSNRSGGIPAFVDARGKVLIGNSAKK